MHPTETLFDPDHGGRAVCLAAVAFARDRLAAFLAEEVCSLCRGRGACACAELLVQDIDDARRCMSYWADALQRLWPKAALAASSDVGHELFAFDAAYPMISPAYKAVACLGRVPHILPAGELPPVLHAFCWTAGLSYALLDSQLNRSGPAIWWEDCLKRSIGLLLGDGPEADAAIIALAKGRYDG